MKKGLAVRGEEAKGEQKNISGNIRRKLLVAAISTVLAVEPLMAACAGTLPRNSVPENPSVLVQRECRNRSPIQENGNKAKEGGSSAGKKMMQEEVIERLRKSTVLIESGESIGSGVILYRCGGETAILTNRHVVTSDKAPAGTVIASPDIRVSNEGKTVRPIRIVIAPQQLDMALIFVREEIGEPLRVAQKMPQVGTRVIIVGNPLGIEDTVSLGIVSNFVKGRSDAGFPVEEIQTDAAINPGNSGGGMFLENGELLGIVTYKLRLGFGFAEGMGYAIPVSIIRDFTVDSWAEIPNAPDKPPDKAVPGKQDPGAKPK